MQKNKTENGFSTETLQLQMPIQMPVLHQCKCISKAGPLRLRQVWAEYKDKVPDVSDSHRNIGTSCNSKLKLPNLKIYVSKLQKDYQNMNECMSA